MSHLLRKFAAVFFALTFILALAGGVGSAAARQDSPALVTISAARDSFTAGQDVQITINITNPGKSTLRVLKWFTPAEDVEEPLLIVAVNGAPVPFLGPTYKRPEPKGDDYLALKSGESLTRTVNLSTYYDLSATGTYSIRYDITALDLFADEKGASKSAGSLTSNQISVSIEGRPTSSYGGIVPDAVTGSTAFNKCTTSQQTSLISARNQASTYSADAQSYLALGKTGSRYTTWFGVYAASRYTTVTSHFKAISNAMDTAPVKFDCGCKKKYYAYVYPNQPYNIYVCSVFWQAPLTGTDSKAGTLIHEMSHFYVVASTNDYVYGQSGAKNLAITDPAKAINNADNHEYFAENTPSLP